jgi:hypothetical protein
MQWNLYLSFLKGPQKTNDECEKIVDAGKLFIFNYLVRIVWKLSLQGTFFIRITNYQGFQNNRVNLYEFYLRGT